MPAKKTPAKPKTNAGTEKIPLPVLDEEDHEYLRNLPPLSYMNRWSPRLFEQRDDIMARVSGKEPNAYQAESAMLLLYALAALPEMPERLEPEWRENRIWAVRLAKKDGRFDNEGVSRLWMTVLSMEEEDKESLRNTIVQSFRVVVKFLSCIPGSSWRRTAEEWKSIEGDWPAMLEYVLEARKCDFGEAKQGLERLAPECAKAKRDATEKARKDLQDFWDRADPPTPIHPKPTAQPPAGKTAERRKNKSWTADLLTAINGWLHNEGFANGARTIDPETGRQYGMKGLRDAFLGWPGNSKWNSVLKTQADFNAAYDAARKLREQNEMRNGSTERSQAAQELKK